MRLRKEKINARSPDQVTITPPRRVSTEAIDLPGVSLSDDKRDLKVYSDLASMSQMQRTHSGRNVPPQQPPDTDEAVFAKQAAFEKV
ncbi:hypothetical protein C0Q70_14015 [Pomacea canaliculata]|uniref:Uncharacterized protein n=1 Tax=Pomacea canaliculata TaxID=400727 RepID=A0A2T7NYV1_POMCA|nr:hypothetical protein C0Q70_14015 [Pomacea canaliculata]